MALIGMGTVFIALVALLVVVKLTPRILGLARLDTPIPLEPAPVGSLDREPAAAGRTDSDDDLLTVALAAYSYHRRRQSSTRPPTAASPWSNAGRMTQIAPFRR
jgi:Na+-transporting methylmalonyl-CoA/oxaloacetate decarboxylase gamma subunit